MSAVPKKIVLYTDGACSGNPGPGGYGAVLLYGEHRRELSGGFSRTTNNRMEICAAIAGLEVLKSPCDVELYSDSSYLVNAVSKGWLRAWKNRGWRKADHQPVLNVDLWKRLDDQLARHAAVTFHWVRGHASNRENNRCDELARAAASVHGLPADSAFDCGSPSLL